MNERLSSTPVSLLQTSSNNGRQEAAAVLNKVAMASGNKALLALASSVQIDAFVKVKEAIDQMIERLNKEGRDEVQLKAYCIEKLNENALTNGEKSNDLSVTQAEINRLGAEIDKLTSEIQQLGEDIKQNQDAIKEAGNDRAQANA